MSAAPTRMVGAVLMRDGRILLGLRGSSARSHHFTWDVFGGHCEAGEDHPVFRLHLFEVEKWHGTPANCSAEHTTIEWHDLTSLAELPLASDRYREILNDLCRRQGG